MKRPSDNNNASMPYEISADPLFSLPYRQTDNTILSRFASQYAHNSRTNERTNGALTVLPKNVSSPRHQTGRLEAPKRAIAPDVGLENWAPSGATIADTAARLSILRAGARFILCSTGLEIRLNGQAWVRNASNAAIGKMSTTNVTLEGAFFHAGRT